MENELAANTSLIFSKAKLDIIGYYDLTKSEIDIKAQTLLLENQANIKKSQQQKDVVETNINKIYEQFIRAVDFLFNENIREINEFANTATKENCIDKELIKVNSLTKYCLFISYDDFDRELKYEDDKDTIIGILLLSNFYLNTNQQNFLKLKLQSNEISSQIKLHLDQDLLRLKYVYDKGYPDFHSIKKKLYIDLVKLNSGEDFDLFKNIEKLNLAFSSIESIDSNAFKNFSSLKHLDLQYNPLKVIKTDCFGELNNLTTLYLNDCSINEIQAFAFKNLENLEYLIFPFNNIQMLKADSFQGLKNLKELSLVNCSIRSIEENAFSGLESLEILDLTGNKLKHLKKNVFYGLDNLLQLKLGFNKIENFDENPLYIFVNLKRLEILFNPILNDMLHMDDKLNEELFKFTYGLNNVDKVILEMNWE